MRSVDATLRANILSGMAAAGISLLAEGTSLELTASRVSVNLSGLRSDDYWDRVGGQYVMGECVLHDSLPVCLWNPYVAGQPSAWYLSDTSGVLTVTSGPDCDPARPGLASISGTLWGYYIEGEVVKRKALSYTAGVSAAFTGSAETIGTVETFNSAAVSVPASNLVQVCGYSAGVMWLKRFVYTGGAWVAGARVNIGIVDNGYALPTTLATSGPVITVAIGEGRAVSFLHPVGKTYSAPYTILGEPPDRRVWPWGMSYINSRYHLVVTTDILGENGFYWAKHARWLSSADGLSWRDEGLLAPQMSSGLRSALAIRGTLMASATTSYLMSATTLALGNLPVQLSATPSLSFSEVPFEIEAQHPGLRATMEMRALVATDVRYEPGIRLTATLTDGSATATLFTGYLDQWKNDLQLGADYTQLIARGSMGRLIGETAYHPAAVVNFLGRGGWYTSFYDKISGTPVNALASDKGEWIAEHYNASYRLYSRVGGTAFIPQPVQGMTFQARVRFSAASDFYLAFGNSREDDKDGTVAGGAWLAGVTEGDLVIGWQYAGAYMELKSAVASGYTSSIEAELVLQVTPGHIKVVLIPYVGAANALWTTLEYDIIDEYVPGPQPENGPFWTAASSVSVYAPRVSVAGVYQDQPVYLREVTLVDGGIPWSVGEVIQQVGDIAGVTVTNTAVTYPAAFWDTSYPYVTLINAKVVYASGMSVCLKGSYDDLGDPTGTMLVLYATYGVLDGVEFPLSATLIAGSEVRVTWYDNLLSLYQEDLLLAAVHCIPTYPTGYLWCTTDMTMLDVYQPSESCAWDYNAPAEDILSRVLERRRVYLTERVDGTIRVSSNPEGSLLIGDTAKVNGYNCYQRAQVRIERNDDARGSVALVGIIGANNTVYLIDEEAPAYGIASLTMDNPWAWTVEDALKECRLTIRDNRRQRQGSGVDGVFDPAMEIRDVFTIPDGTQWLVESYQWSWGMERQAVHNDSVTAIKRVTADGTANWGAGTWGDFKWS